MPVPARRLPLLTGTVGAVLIAGSAPLVRLAGVAPLTSAAFRCAYALPVLALLAWRERRRSGPRAPADRRWALVAGVCFAVDLGAWHTAIDAVGAGLATVLGNVQVVVVGLVAWALLGERPRRGVLLGVPIVFVGIVLIAGITGDAYGADPVAGVLFGLLTAVAYSGFILALRQGNRDVTRPAGPLLDATLVAAVGLLAGAVVTGAGDLVPSLPAHGWLVALALNSQVVAWLLISVSLPRLPAVVTSVLLMLQPVGAVAIGVALLDESPSTAQSVGIAVVLVGVLVATTGAAAPDREHDPSAAPS